ncbi:MAG: response regulator [Gammaproteobacteria bacterium]|nr:MAG: response regulator [Gammaproteobacteria bacterium]
MIFPNKDRKFLTYFLPLLHGYLINSLKEGERVMPNGAENLLLKGIESIEKNAVFLLSPDGKVVSWNQGAERLTGFAASEVQQESITRLYEEEVVKSGYVTNLFTQIKDLGSQKTESWWVRKDNSRFLASVNLTAIYDESQQLAGFIGISEDITEREKLVENQRIAIEDYQYFFRSFISELRNAITPTGMTAQMLKRSYNIIKRFVLPYAVALSVDSVTKKTIHDSMQEIEDLIHLMHNSANDQKRISDNFVEFIKLEERSEKLNYSYFNPKEMILSLIRAFNRQARQKNINISIKEELPKEDLFIECDEVLLTQALSNLLRNAIKINQTRSVSITISMKYESLISSPNHVGVTFSISHSGGWTLDEKKKHKKITGYDIHEATRYGYGGSDLFITKEIVKLIDGNIEIESEKEKSTQFNVNLLCRKISLEEIKSMGGIKRPVCAVTGRQKNILVVENYPTNQGMFDLFLQGENHNCHIANNGVEAIGECVKNKFDIIFMNIDIPILNGIEATKQIRKIEKEENRPSSYIVGISINATLEQQNNAYLAGMSDYFSKPFDMEQISQIILDSERFSNGAALPSQKRARRGSIELSPYALFQPTPTLPSLPTVLYTFESDNYKNAKVVVVAGTFNGLLEDQERALSPDSNTVTDWIMEKTPTGQWRLEKPLPMGHHQYKLVVDYDQWGPLKEVDISLPSEESRIGVYL